MTSSSPDLKVDPGSVVAPYEQLRTQIATRVADGTLPAGTKLATVRQLAADLGVAPTTVARAYRELEADEVIVTQGRRGTFVRSDVLTPGGSRADLAAEFVASARRAGLTLAEATRLVERAWGG